MKLWDEKTLDYYTVPAKKPLAQFVMEQTLKYGIGQAEIPGLLSTLLGGNIPDTSMNFLMSKNIRELSQMTVEELEMLPGLGKTKAVRLAAAFELTRRLSVALPEERPVVRQPNEVVALVMDEMRYLDREHFRVLLLNSKSQVITIEQISVGTLNESYAHPREIFKNAIKRSAATIIVVHNHPSGDPTPSLEDIDLTKRLVDAGKIIGIEVLDHIIIGDGKFTSLKRKGLM